MPDTKKRKRLKAGKRRHSSRIGGASQSQFAGTSMGDTLGQIADDAASPDETAKKKASDEPDRPEDRPKS